MNREPVHHRSDRHRDAAFRAGEPAPPGEGRRAVFPGPRRRFPAALLAALLLAAGALRAEDPPPPPPRPEAVSAEPVEERSAGGPGSKGESGEETATGFPGGSFVPSERITADQAVDLPADI